jgi:hypothetical protein
VHHSFEAMLFSVIKEEEWELTQSELQLKDEQHQ